MQVELKQFSDKHIPALCELLNNENVSKWLLQVPFPYTQQDAEVWINKCKDHTEKKTDFVFAIEKDGLLNLAGKAWEAAQEIKQKDDADA